MDAVLWTQMNRKCDTEGVLQPCGISEDEDFSAV